jgi:hypothetical protein
VPIEPKHHRNLKWAATLLRVLVVFSPAIFLAWHISQNAVNSPVWDDWERAPLIEKFREGTLTFKDLYAPHIDHRIFFPRLIILALNELSGGDLRLEMAFSFFVALGAALGVWQLARMTVFRGRTIWGVLLVANLIIFSPISWDNWIWGIQLAFMMPMTCTIWALVVALMHWAWWKRLLLCGVLAIIGTHSFGHGFAVWPAIFGVALLQPAFTQTKAQRIAFIVCWAVLAVAVIGCYTLVDFRNASDETHSYHQKPGEAPPGMVHHSKVYEEPGLAAQFISVLAGNPFARMHLVDPILSADFVGRIILLMFVAGCLLWLVGLWRCPDWSAKALPWLTLGSAALTGMLAIAAGRLNVMGILRASSIRYVSISLYLAIAVLMLGVLWWQHRHVWGCKSLKSYWGVSVLAVFAGFMIPAWNHGIQMMKLCKQGRLQSHASLMFIEHFDPFHFWRLDGSIDFPRRQAKILNDYGLINPPLVKSLDIAQFKPITKPRSDSQAQVTRLELTPEKDKLIVEGLGRIGGRPADLVLLTCETPGSPAMIFGLGETTAEMLQQDYPGDLELSGRIKPLRNHGFEWDTTVPLSRLWDSVDDSQQNATIKAWVFDAAKARAYRIRGEWQLHRDGLITKPMLSSAEPTPAPPVSPP